MTSKINVNGNEYDLKRIEDRSKVLQIIKDTMKGCDTDYFECQGDFKIDY
jgi:hypothetical protein